MLLPLSTQTRKLTNFPVFSECLMIITTYDSIMPKYLATGSSRLIVCSSVSLTISLFNISSFYSSLKTTCFGTKKCLVTLNKRRFSSNVSAYTLDVAKAPLYFALSKRPLTPSANIIRTRHEFRSFITSSACLDE